MGLRLTSMRTSDYFKNIIPCGIDDKSVTSVSQELGTDHNLEAVEVLLKNNIVEQFGMELI